MNYLLPVLAAVLWGINTLVSKLSAGAIGPDEISFLRWFLAVVILFPFAFKPLIRHKEQLFRDWWKLGLLGILGSVIYQSISYHAAAYTSAINMGVIQALVPLLTIMLASLTFRLPPSRSMVTGALISLAGVLVVISGGHLETLGAHGVNRGDAMMLVAVISMSVYNTLLKHWQLNLPLLVSMFGQAAAAAVVLFPFYLVADKHSLTLVTSGMIAYATVGASVIAPMAWIAGSRRLGPARVSLFFNLIPIVTAVLAIVLLSEPFTWSLLFGGVLVLLGVTIVEVRRLAAPRLNA